MKPLLSIPYVPDVTHFAIDDMVSFIVSALIAVMVNAEGQGFMATLLGDTHPDRSRRLHFNAFLHLDLLGTLCFLVAGFGWPRKVMIDPSRFSSPRIHMLICRVAGPVANLLMASIAGSIVWILTRYGAEDRVFTMVVIVNLTMAVYGLLPIAPLAGSGVLDILCGPWQGFLRYYHLAGPYLLIGLFLLERLTQVALPGRFLDPLVVAAVDYLTGT
ncbi:site-2 protease family protein [Desulfonema ishimotonii]|uniref:Site-2 protease family protein n=1 Tax=Desulfonema ishimotonii TaxID=45657 RepID=A0A401FV45_9BACT|nr:site-2 protease family protein [Desulfonema ishimotonii]GBC60823.1 site-2 protease family protein [Desulfonema ishimotonii]